MSSPSNRIQIRRYWKLGTSIALPHGGIKVVADHFGICRQTASRILDGQMPTRWRLDYNWREIREWAKWKFPEYREYYVEQTIYYHNG